MTETMNKLLAFAAIALVLASCSSPVQRQLPQESVIFPDYRDITVPPNIAPLNFQVNSKRANASFDNGSERITLKARNGLFRIPVRKWKELAKPGSEITVTVYLGNGSKATAMEPFTWTIATEEIDPFIAYRLIEPGYEAWNEMGIYQRELGTYRQSAIITNRQTGKNCMNCHSFQDRSHDRMLFHMRAVNGGTYIIQGSSIEKLNTKTDSTISALVYPAWHPGGQFVAFSVNDTRQAFHSNDRNRIEVFDTNSDVVVYDVSSHEVFSSPALKSEDSFETFPAFTPDGKTLIFCTAKRRNIPEEYDKVMYNLCSVSFDPGTKSFGDHVDTLFNAEAIDRSASFPRVSPDGKHLLFTLSGYGNFSIWHKDADLQMLDLETRDTWPLTEANSSNVDSYHSWSSNGRWIIFSSRRIDGLYTRPFIAYVTSDGEARKAFLLPQKNPASFYKDLMKSYNIPEFIDGEVSFPQRKIVKTALEDPGIQVTYSQGSTE